MDKFKFFCPADIEKGIDPKTGQEEMRIKGIGSSPNRDKQGEYLDPSGFDLTDFRWVNFNHLGKSDPATIIGEPDKAKCKITENNEFWFEGVLYSELPMAKATFDLMKALRSSPSGNKLSLSVEGKVLERGSNNPKDAAYNRIKRSKITAIAVCPTPINGDTWVDLITKGFTGEDKDEEYDEDTKKAMEAEGAVTSKESVEHDPKDLNKKPLRKSEVYDRIIRQYPNIEINKAKSVYSLIENIAKMEDKANEVSTETLNKAFDILNLASAEISKASKEEKESEEKEEKKKGKGKEKDEDDDMEKDLYEKALKTSRILLKEGKSNDEAKEALIKKGYGETIITKALEKAATASDLASDEIKEEVQKSFESITDLIKSQSDDFNKKFNAIGQILKAQTDENAELKKSLDATLEANEALKNDVEKALSQPAGARKSVKSFTERFEKSQDGKNVYNIASQADRKVLKDKIMDLSGINKNTGEFDRTLTRIAQNIELMKSADAFSVQDLQKLESYDIKIVTQ